MRFKKPIILSVLAVCLCGVLALAASVMSVQVRNGQIRATPSFLGQIVGKAGYGQQVTVSGEQGDWLHVSTRGTSGWMHRSALTTQQLALSGGGQTAEGVSGKEMALAGKGFSAQIEADYRRAHGGDYAAINRMERISFSPQALLAFLARGDVKPEGGAR